MDKTKSLRNFMNNKNQKEMVDKANNKLFPEFSKNLNTNSKKDIFFHEKIKKNKKNKKKI